MPGLALRLRRYSALRTLEGKKFLPLRVGGLALELAYKKARDKGFGGVTAEHLPEVRIAARKVQTLQDGEWNVYPRVCYLTVADAERRVALDALAAQRLFAADYHLWAVDLP